MLRRNVQRALNRGESYHKLRRAVAYAYSSRLRVKTDLEQQIWSECSRLLANSVIYYNACILSELLERKERQGDQRHADHIKRVSPVSWKHVNFYGEGEWKVRQHGYTKRRTWRKLHRGVDEGSGEVVATVLSTNNVDDSEVLADLLDQIDEPIEQLSADGSYDTWEIHADLQQRGIRAAIPPRKTARIRQRKNSQEISWRRDDLCNKATWNY